MDSQNSCPEQIHGSSDPVRPGESCLAAKYRRSASKYLLPMATNAQSELDYRSILDDSTHAIRIINKDFTIRWCNKAFCKIAGISRSKTFGKKCWELFASPNCHTHGCSMSRLLAGESQVRIESERSNASGDSIPCIINTAPLYSSAGEVIAAVQTIRDLRLRRKYESRINEFEDYHRAIIKASSAIGEAIIILKNSDDKEGVHAFVSSQWLNITGYDNKELLRLTFFDLVAPEDRQSSLERYRKRMAGKEMPGLYEVNIIHKSGHGVPVELTSATTTHNGNRSVVIFLREITERKKMLNELENYRIHLEELVETRTTQYKIAANALIKEAARRKRDQGKLKELYKLEKAIAISRRDELERNTGFLRALVHELKTPLAPVSIACDVLVAQEKEGQPSEVLKIIQNGIISLNDRIDDLLDLAKGEMGLLKLNCEPAMLAQIIKETCHYMSYAMEAKDQKFSLEISRRLPDINIDEKRIRQVIINLLDNASKYTPKGGRIEVKAYKQGSNTIVETSDTGLGIKPEERKAVFEPYYGLKSSRSVHKGLGLGLSLAKMIVGLHGGKIWVKNRKAPGSTLVFSLPLDFKP